MKNLFYLFMFLLYLQAPGQVPWLNGESQADDLRIKLVTFGSGDDIPSWWGHGGIIVEDVANQISRVYNFGLYSFDQTMLLRFVMGRLIFSVGDFSVPAYLKYYEQLNRDVRIQTLDLPPQKRLELARKLALNVLPEHRDYLYDHYYDNCSTRLRDVINQAVDGALFEATDVPGRMTLRGHTRRYVGHNPLMEFLLMYLMNDDIDQPISQWDEMFLPDELERYVEALSYRDENGQTRKLVSDSYIYYKADRKPIPQKIPLHWPYALLLGLIAGALVYALALWIRNSKNSWPNILYGLYTTTLGLLLGIPGLSLALLASFSHHTVTYHNENLFLANPLTFLLIPLGFGLTMNKKWSWKWLSWIWYIHLILLLIGLALKLLPAFDQNNGLIISFIVPLYLVNICSLQLIKSEQMNK